MSIWSRIANAFRADRLRREIDEELESHLSEALERGRTSSDARNALGSVLRHREASLDIRVFGWLDSLRADIVFGWRPLRKYKVSSAAAVLSLGLAIGSCTAAFRLVDALLLRPLPVTHPEQLYVAERQSVGDDGNLQVGESSSYPLFRMMQASMRGQAQLLAISYAERGELAYGAGQEPEKAYLQYVSGAMFESFGLRPAAGRLLTDADDLTPGAHPYAAISYDYWTRRFGQDWSVVGRTFRMGLNLYQIVGVVGKGFTGTEPGTMVDVFLPAMMKGEVIHQPYSWWLRAFVRVPPGLAVQTVRDRLDIPFRAFQDERIKTFTGISEQRRMQVLGEKVVLVPAAAGISGMQKNYRLALSALSVLVALVLLIACANVANLMTAKATARMREMALRISIGAGRGRLIQLVLIESAWIAFLAASLGSAFAWWSAPVVIRLISAPDNPVRLALSADWRVLSFAFALASAVTLLLGMAPALRASNVRPASALKGGEDPHARKRLINALIAVQVAFCVIVLLVSNLFVATYDRLAHQPTGFSSERLLSLDVVTAQPQLPVYWEQVASHLRTVPGVERVALAGWPLVSNQGWNGPVTVPGAFSSQTICDFLNVSPGWLAAMKIPLLDGRDLQDGDVRPGTAIVNESFAKAYFHGENPVGKTFLGMSGNTPVRIVGLVRDARYWNMKDPMEPAAYLPFTTVNGKGVEQPVKEASFLVRTAAEDPLGIAALLRREVSAAHSGFRVSNLRTQKELVERSTVRERLLAVLAIFFSLVALTLAGVGLFGVLDYSVLQRKREIGIRLALGSPMADVVWQVVRESLAMVLIGAVAGLCIAVASQHYLTSLLYQVTATDAGILLFPTVAILVAALLAALPPAFRAVRLDPVNTLRAE